MPKQERAMRNLLQGKTLSRAIVPLTVLLAFCCLLLTGCRSLCPKGEVFHPEGELLAYVKMTGSASLKFPQGDWGVFVYLDSYGSITTLNIYEVWDGRLIRPKIITNWRAVQDLEDIGFEPFDYAAEVEECVRKLGDKKWLGAIDGIEQEIFIHTKNGDFLLRKWNPYCELEFYAQYSDRIARLKAYLDSLSEIIGKSEALLY
jgi:hypothetical protein